MSTRFTFSALIFVSTILTEYIIQYLLCWSWLWCECWVRGAAREIFDVRGIAVVTGMERAIGLRRSPIEELTVLFQVLKVFNPGGVGNPVEGATIMAEKDVANRHYPVGIDFIIYPMSRIILNIQMDI